MKMIKTLRSFGSQRESKYMTNKSVIEPLALKFANHLVKERYDSATQMISIEKQTDWNSNWIKSEYLEMIEYGEGKPNHIEVMVFDSMNEWPSKNENDLGWVYVAICGEGYNEAVALIFSECNKETMITNIEWGRP